jgi:Tfp pilus assembly protein PilF
MSSTRSTSSVLAAAALLALLSGCATSSFAPSHLFGISSAPADDAEVSSTDHDELPPKEAARACLLAGQEMQNSGHIEQAIALFEKARNKDPNMKSVAHRLAVLYDAQGDSPRALAEYNKAVEADPQNPSLLSDLGYYYFERGNHAEAEKSLRAALAIDPKHTKSLGNLGLVLAAQGRFDESFAAFSAAVGPAAAHSNVGVLRARQGQYDQAKREFHQALAIDPTLRQPRAFLEYLEHRPENGRDQSILAVDERRRAE